MRAQSCSTSAVTPLTEWRRRSSIGRTSTPFGSSGRFGALSLRCSLGAANERSPQAAWNLWPTRPRRSHRRLAALIGAFNDVNNYKLLEQSFPVEIIEVKAGEDFQIFSGLRAAVVSLHTPQ